MRLCELVDNLIKPVAHDYTIAYIYISPLNKERLTSFKGVAGDSFKTLITQYVRGWIGRNRDYYIALARMDAESRSISLSQWGETVVRKGIEALPEYTKDIKEIPSTPLHKVELEPESVRFPINYIKLGTQNLAFLRVGIHYDGRNPTDYISRIVKEHLDRNWEKLYQPQVDAENFENWT